MRGRRARVSDRAIGIVLGIVLGLAVIVLFLFLGSRNTIDEPSIGNNAPSQTQTAPQPPKPGLKQLK
jgi:ABC-type Mn2+/Zn2+ transport system permease subunit